MKPLGEYDAMWRDIWRKRRLQRLQGRHWGLLFESYFWERVGFSILVIIWLVTLFWKPVFAHDAADWIQRGGYRNTAGELCCGKRDCDELEDGRVAITNRGYRVTLTQESPIGIAVYYEYVPFNEAQPSPDGRYWRCQWGGVRKCFFAPPQGT